ncbi:MAG: hypothetical protein M3R70_00935 [Actinomycetota bacterium]|nr:hypothetical protein [Actinomycetota bacterium]
MKIAYLCYWNAYGRDGVVAKIEGQVSRWRVEGHAARIFALSPPGAGKSFADDVFTFESARGRAAAGARLIRELEAFAPDLVYLRYDLFPPAVWRAVRRTPTVIEVNSDDRREWARRGVGGRAFNALNRRLVLGAAAGIVFVTRELAASPAFARYTRRRLVLGNGLDPGGVEALSAPANERPRLVFVGTPDHPWHGVDKIADLARRMRGADFDLVGPDPAMAGLPANATAHGLLERESYLPILARADAALGTLAFHRNGMDEGSPLKVREYLLAGLPVVIGYEDTDFAGEEPWFLLRLPNTESNVVENVSAIQAFVSRVRGRRVPRELVADRVGTKAKEAARLEFFERVLSDRRSRRSP